MEEVILPDGWVKGTLSQSVCVQSGIGFPKKYQGKLKGDFPVYKVGDVSKAVLQNSGRLNTSGSYISKYEADELKGQVFRKGATLFAKIGEAVKLNRRAIVERPGLADNNVMAVFAFLEDMDRFIHYFMRTVDLSQISRSTTIPSIRKGDIEEFSLAYPPLAEQKVIADKLDTLLTQVESIKTRLERIPLILKRSRQSILAAAVSGKLTEEWRASNETKNIQDLISDNNKLKKGLLKIRGEAGWDADINLFELPKNWAWIENHNLAEDSSSSICAGPFGTIFKAKDFRDEGIPIIFLRHVKKYGFNQKNPNFMDEKVWHEFHQEYSVYGGELLVAKLGDPPGECCIYPRNCGVAMVTPDVLKMNVDSNVANKNYLMHFFNSPVSKKMVSDAAFGATRLRIDIALFKKLPIPLPPIEEQNVIANRIEQFFTYARIIEQQVHTALARVNNLPQSILGKAFRGELTVDWRAANLDLINGENSAESLLAKIKIEREVLTTQPKKRKPVVKNKIGETMSKQIIQVIAALKTAGKPLSGQELLVAAGYPSDSSTEQLEQFFLDLRDALFAKNIIKQSRDVAGQDWFALAG